MIIIIIIIILFYNKPPYCRLDELKAGYAANGLDTADPRVVEDKIWNKLKIGVHYELEVTCKKWGKELTNTPQQRVTQVLASAAAGLHFS